MMTRISSVITQLTCDLSALAGKPAALSASLYLASSQPSIWASPILVESALPSVAGTDLNEMPCFVRKSFALSQSVNFDHGPTKIWKLQSVAATVIGVLRVAASSAGFT